MQPEQFPLGRRDLVTGLGAVALGGLGMPLTAFAADDNSGSDIYTPPGLQRDPPPEAGTLPGAVFDVKAPFDLDDKVQYRYARLKTMKNLIGQKSYFATISRHSLCPPNVTPYPFINEVELTTVWLERPEGADEHTCVVRATFTRVPIHPQTYEPIREIENPYLGETIRLKDTLFAGGGYVLRLGPDQPDDFIVQADKPYYRFGDDIGFVMYDPRAGEGFFQPRIDTVVWRAKAKDLMDPDKDLIKADYTYTSLMRASVFRWSKIPETDPTQILGSKAGTKVNSVDELPDMVKDVILSKYPDRA